MLYHRDAYGLPPLRFKPIEGITLSWHARHQADFKKIDINKVNLDTFNPSEWTIFELEVLNGIPYKIVARKELNEDTDLVIVLIRGDKRIITLWANKKDDLHSTLDKSAYARP